MLLELNTNQSLKESAKEQAGLKQDKDFQITDFNYNVDTVAKVLTKHLSNINFIGVSVCMTAIVYACMYDKGYIVLLLWNQVLLFMDTLA